MLNQKSMVLETFIKCFHSKGKSFRKMFSLRLVMYVLRCYVEQLSKWARLSLPTNPVQLTCENTSDLLLAVNVTEGGCLFTPSCTTDISLVVSDYTLRNYLKPGNPILI